MAQENPTVIAEAEKKIIQIIRVKAAIEVEKKITTIVKVAAEGEGAVISQLSSRIHT